MSTEPAKTPAQHFADVITGQIQAQLASGSAAGFLRQINPDATTPEHVDEHPLISEDEAARVMDAIERDNTPTQSSPESN